MTNIIKLVSMVHKTLLFAVYEQGTLFMLSGTNNTSNFNLLLSSNALNRIDIFVQNLWAITSSRVLYSKIVYIGILRNP